MKRPKPARLGTVWRFRSGDLPNLSKAFAWLYVLLLATTAAADGLSVTAPDCAPSFQPTSAGLRISAPGYATISSPGDPALPFKDLYIILPPNANPSSVSAALVGATTQTTSSGGQVAPAPPMVTGSAAGDVQDWGPGKRIEAGRNTLVYGADSFYPRSNVEVVAVGSLRKWRIATVRYYPFRYNPIIGVLERTTGGTISVSVGASAAAMSASASMSSDTVFLDKVKSLAANYDAAQSWYGTTRATALSSASADSETTDYVILTTSAVVRGSSKLEAFVAHKRTRGFHVEVDTEAQWGGGVGNAAAENIRSYLQSNYIAKGIQYVLLIGNPNPSSGDVPMKMLWPRYSAEDTYREAPSDYYYADLTGNWDLNGNGYYGEQNADFGPGGVDRLPEVMVGRIPFYGDFTALDSILQKTMDYESGVIHGPWVRNVLLSMKPSDGSTPGYQLGEAIKAAAATPAGMTATRVYDLTYDLSPPPEHTPCLYETVLSAWQQHAGFHFWWAHGNETLAADVFSTDNCQLLDDAYPSFTFQCSCLNGSPETPTNLGFSLLKRGAVATDSASRVSWYYPGETVYTNTDSNAGMTYQYAVNLIRDHLPCGDAHYKMMIQVPNSIWMNHCVFNLYGDPSLSCQAPPEIYHTPLRDTDISAKPYLVMADIRMSTPVAAGYPTLRWNTSGAGASFDSVQMANTTGTIYEAGIPAQPYGTTVYYYIEAADVAGLSSRYPSDSPQSLVSFDVAIDTTPPLIVHEPLPDTGNKFGPYAVTATVIDNMPLASVTLHHNINGGPYSTVDMQCSSGNTFTASIPGPASAGDVIGYYITATDSSLNANASRLPESGCFSFEIAPRICVAILDWMFDWTSGPPYFVGGNADVWSQVSDVINSDPQNRFQVTVLTSLKPGPGSNGLEGQDVLVLPDNAVPMDALDTVAEWFRPGKVILGLDSAVCYAGYTGWMWPDSAGSNGYGAYWDYDSGSNNQEIWADDPITAEYSVGQVIGSVPIDAQYYVNALPSDARVLAGKAGDPSRAYAVYRDVPGRGRIVLLGPFAAPLPDQAAMIRDALVAPQQLRTIVVHSPNGGETYQAGERVAVKFSAYGVWDESDTVRLEYCTGLDGLWQPIPGAQTLPHDAGTFTWDTTGLPGSHSYRVRITSGAEDASDQSDRPFTIIPTVDIAQAKATSEGQLLRVAGKVVTCTSPGFTYVEEPDRRAGIRVTSVQNLYLSALVDISGTITTINGERVIDAETTATFGPSSEIGPYILKTAALGGGAFGYQAPVMEYRWIQQSGTTALMPAVGLNNIGLLVRVCGKVTATGQDWFYIDDGSNCDDGSGNVGVKVFCPGITPPSTSEFVLMKAVSTTYFDRGALFRALVLPDAGSIESLR